ncbi:GNAT family N-acetyltransferase [Conexibacter sp. DBS9H8]|uniref:GNAT family N-acetyltransferase n=1 Tax=Conexibacter sp. DBS9H8 TaxID=2937801 RepID=UPI00200BFE00|nr:GNAT family N-acetyltransferase [Conexibacter sp. DBS9H8]
MVIDELDLSELDLLRELDRRIRATDGVTLKLEWADLEQARTAASLVAREDGAIAGFLGLYAFGAEADVELCGMVAPEHRRSGIATALLTHGRALATERGLTRHLLIVPRASASGVAFRTGLPSRLEHSEHTMRLDGLPDLRPPDPRITVRAATAADRDALATILTAGFGPPPEGMLTPLHREDVETVIVCRAGEPVGTARLARHGPEGSIFGFAIDPAHRGRGIGRDVLGRFCATLLGGGCDRVGLQVAVDNERALSLYTATGFRRVSTEDYYELH